MNPTLLILAAGIGSRYGDFKQIDGIGPNGEWMIEYSIFDAMHAGFRRIVLVVGEDTETAFREYFADKLPRGMEVDYVLQEVGNVSGHRQSQLSREKPWGTGHAVLVAASRVHEPFAVINADDFYGNESFKIVFSFLSAVRRKQRSDYCLVGYRLANTLSDYGTVSRAICEIDENGYLVGLTERNQIFKTRTGVAQRDEAGESIAIDVEQTASMNLMGFTPSVFEHLDIYFTRFLTNHGQDASAEFYLPSAVHKMVRTKVARVKVLNTSAQWFGVTYKKDKPAAAKNILHMVDSGIYPENLWK